MLAFAFVSADAPEHARASDRTALAFPRALTMSDSESDWGLEALAEVGRVEIENANNASRLIGLCLDPARSCISTQSFVAMRF